MTTHPNTRLAKSLARLCLGQDPIARQLQDRQTPVSEATLSTLLHLPQFGIAERRPRSPTNRKGQPRPTDMDLGSWLVHLAKAEATVVTLPAYDSALPRRHDEAVTRLGNARRGRLVALSSHREHLSFGVTLEDASCVVRSDTEADTLGALRTFLILDHNGAWHPGYHGLSWRSRQVEQIFRERFALTEDIKHQSYQYFVHPNRRQSIYSRAHLLMKLAVARLEEERKARGYTKQTGNTAGTPEPGRDAIRTTFTMKLHGLRCRGEYPTTPIGEARSRYYSWYLRTLQFITRANELAWYQYGRSDHFIANWLSGYRWEVHHQDERQASAMLYLMGNVGLSYRRDIVVKTVA